MLVLARLLRLGFLGDFLSASVLVGFLTGVGIQVAAGQIPGMLGVPKGTGNWFEQQWNWITEIPDIGWATFAFALGTIAVIFVSSVPAQGAGRDHRGRPADHRLRSDRRGRARGRGRRHGAGRLPADRAAAGLAGRTYSRSSGSRSPASC